MIINNSGGGAGLNFKILSGTIQPAYPAENTIWVSTETEISAWEFSATQPANPVEGMLWFETATNATTAFNALKKNNISLYPIVCRQYIDGAWLRKNSEIYQSGKWSLWWDGTLYSLGDEYSGITGGWVGEAISFAGKNAYVPYLSINSNNISISNRANGGVARLKNKIDLSGFDVLTVEGSFSGDSTYDSWLSVNVWTSLGATVDANRVAWKGILRTVNTVKLDLSNVSGECYIGVFTYTDTSARIDRMYLE